MAPTLLLTVDAVNTFSMQEFAKFVASSPYRTDSELRGALRASIREAILEIDPLSFLERNPEVGEWPHADRFELDRTSFGVLRSAVGERIWEKNLDNVVRLNGEMLRDNLQTVVQGLLKDVSDEIIWSSKDVLALKTKMKSIASDVEQSGVTIDNLDQIVSVLTEGSKLVKGQAIAHKDKELERRMYPLVDRVFDLCRKRDELVAWLTPGMGMTP